MGGNVLRLFKNDKYYECHKLFITDHDEASVDVYGFKGLLALTMGRKYFWNIQGNIY